MSQRRFPAVAITLSLVLLLGVADLLVLDRYAINGIVQDVETGNPVAGAKVLISVEGVEPRRPIPHSGGGGGRCIASYVRETDSSGRFAIDVLAENRMLVKKTASVEVFKPNWYQLSPVRSQIRAGLFGSATALVLPLHADKGERWSFIYNSHSMAPITTDRESEAYQKTMSRALTSEANIAGGQALCDDKGLDLAVSILTYVASKAQTDDERHYILLRCAELREKMSALATRESDWTAVPSAKLRVHNFRFTCDASLFSLGTDAPSGSSALSSD